MQRLEMFKILMVMAAADKKFTSEEAELLALRSHRWGLTDEQFKEALEFARSGPTSLPFPEAPKDRERLLRDMLEVMAADGELAPVEKKLYALAAGAMGLSGEDLDEKLDEWL